MSVAVFDTSAIFAAVVEEDPHHEQARGIFRKMGQCILPTTVVTELAYVFWKHKIPGRVLHAIVTHPKIRVVCDTKAQKSAVEDLAGRNLSLLRLNDLTILLTAQRHNTPLVSFDRQLRADAKNRGIKVLPENI